MKKRTKKIKDINQASFYFEDYLETNKKNKFSKEKDKFQDRIYLLFFFFSFVNPNFLHKDCSLIFKQDSHF